MLDAEPKSKTLRGALLLAAIFGLAGIIVMLQARYAQVHHTMLAPHLKRAPMTPAEGYFGGFLFFAVAIYCIIFGFRDARRQKP